MIQTSEKLYGPHGSSLLYTIHKHTGSTAHQSPFPTVISLNGSHTHTDTQTHTHSLTLTHTQTHTHPRAHPSGPLSNGLSPLHSGSRLMSEFNTECPGVGKHKTLTGQTTTTHTHTHRSHTPHLWLIHTPTQLLADIRRS